MKTKTDQRCSSRGLLASVVVAASAGSAVAQVSVFEPFTPGGQLVPTGASHDGRVVVGYHRVPGVIGSETFVVVDGEMLQFPELPLALCVSGDASMIVGSEGASLWRFSLNTGVMESIVPTLPWGALLLGGLSFDGSALSVVQIVPRQTLVGNGYVWRAETGLVAAYCPQFATVPMTNVAVASDGVTTAIEGAGVSFVRRSDGTCQNLLRPPGTDVGISVRAISGDGSTVIGQAGGLASRWRNGVGEVLGIPAVGWPPISQVVAVSGNGSVIGGFAGITRTGDAEFVWSDQFGLQFVADAVSAWGGTLPVGGPSFLHAISGDGRTLVGNTYGNADGTGPARLWIARQPGCSDIDFNNDGLFPSDDDLVDYLRVLAGGVCSTEPPFGSGCDSLDFNGDTITPSDEDIIAFLQVLSGGACA